jgi:NAD-dependent DNA ligase
MITIEAPTKCPSCSGVVLWVTDQIYCRNDSCPAQSSKKIEHFAKTMKIKGLGPVAIAKLQITLLQDIYAYSQQDMAEALDSTKLAEKLYLEIGNSMKASLNRLLPAFSIPLVGNSAAKKLAAVCDSIFDIDATTCKQAKLGEKTTNNLLEFIDYNYDLISELPFSFNFEKPRSSGSNGIVCISGRLKSYKTKAEATGILESLGYTVKASLTKDVTILINESGVESAKTQKARTSGITIVTNLKDFIGEINK